MTCPNFLRTKNENVQKFSDFFCNILIFNDVKKLAIVKIVQKGKVGIKSACLFF